MENKRNIVLDLLPLYLADEVSEASKEFVEDFAKTDEEIAALIKTGQIEQSFSTKQLDMSENLEMKTLKRVQDSIHRKMFIVAVVTATILLIPLIAMNFTDEVNWGILDFVVMAVLLLSIGFTYIFLTRAVKNLPYQVAVGLALFSCFLLIWINLAVGIIGSSNHPANLLYFLLILITVVLAFKANFKAKAMFHVMLIAAAVQFVIPFIALIFWNSTMTQGDNVIGVFFINSVIALFFGISAFLFKKAA